MGPEAIVALRRVCGLPVAQPGVVGAQVLQAVKARAGIVLHLLDDRKCAPDDRPDFGPVRGIPNAAVRIVALRETFYSGNKDVVKESARILKNEMINQIFDAPHGMATGGVRKSISKSVLALLSRDELRPHLPRFFGALAHPNGGTLSTSMDILVSFGDEVVNKLESLIDSETDNVRYNALWTCQRILRAGHGSPELETRVRAELKSIKDAFDARAAKAKEAGDTAAWTKDLKRSGWAGKLLKEMDQEKNDKQK